MSIWRGRFVRTTTRRELVSGCEAFLAGRYLASAAQHHRLVPSWVWVNTLAHGPRDEIESLARMRSSAFPGSGAASYLAGELLALVDRRGVTLEAVQRAVLIPFELEFEPASCLLGSREMTAGVLAALDRAATLSRL